MAETTFPRTAFIGKTVEYDPKHPPEVGEYAFVDGKIKIGRDVVIGDNARIQGEWDIKNGILLGHGCELIGKGMIGDDAKIRYSSILLGEIELGSAVKIMNSWLCNKVKVGEGSQISKSSIGTYPIGTQHIIIGDYNTIVESSLYGILTMGKKNKINDATLGSHPQIAGEKSLDSYLIIGDANQIRESSSIQGAPTKKRATRIGNNCNFMAITHVAHDCEVEDNVILVTGSQIAGHVHIGKYAAVSGQNGVAPYVHIGPYAYTKGGLDLRCDVLPFFRGDPEKNTRTINTIGLDRANVPKHHVEEIKEAYKIIFDPGYKGGEEALRDLVSFSQTLPDPSYIQMLATFIQESYADKNRKLHIHRKDMKENGQQKIEEFKTQVNNLEESLKKVEGELEQLKQKQGRRKPWYKRIIFFWPHHPEEEKNERR